jgi:hypothetical protein
MPTRRSIFLMGGGILCAVATQPTMALAIYRQVEAVAARIDTFTFFVSAESSGEGRFLSPPSAVAAAMRALSREESRI